MKLGHHKETPPHIPFISLADIAWQIVIFFLVASTFLVLNAMKIDFPDATSSAQSAQKPPETITVQASETALAINGQTLRLEELTPRLLKLLANKKTEQERAVILSETGEVTFQRDLNIMDAIRLAGGIVLPEEEK